MITLLLIGLLAIILQFFALATAFAAGREHSEKNNKAADKFIAASISLHVITFALASIALSLGL